MMAALRYPGRIKGVVFAELQNQFASGVPTEHKQQISEQHDKMATVISKIANEIMRSELSKTD